MSDGCEVDCDNVPVVWTLACVLISATGTELVSRLLCEEVDIEKEPSVVDINVDGGSV